MGFSWSSYLAQSTLLACLAAAGFDSRLIADDQPPPVRLDLTAALATDDVMVFSAGSRPEARAAVRRIDAAIHEAGIRAHSGKDINEDADCTVIGIDLVDGLLLTPSASKMVFVLCGITWFLRGDDMLLSVLEMQTFLGHIAWIALLCRPVFSCLHVVYDFARQDDIDRTALPKNLVGELALFASLPV